MNALSREQRSLELRLASILPANEFVASTEHPDDSAAHDRRDRLGQKRPRRASVLIAAPPQTENDVDAAHSLMRHGESQLGEARRAQDTAASPALTPENPMRVKA